jgi:hypothetical protein
MSSAAPSTPRSRALARVESSPDVKETHTSPLMSPVVERTSPFALMDEEAREKFYSECRDASVLHPICPTYCHRSTHRPHVAFFVVVYVVS